MVRAKNTAKANIVHLDKQIIIICSVNASAIAGVFDHAND